MDMSAHRDHGGRAGEDASKAMLTLAEAARLVDRSESSLRLRVKQGSLVVQQLGGCRRVSVDELIRVGLLASDGRPPALPGKLGLPLIIPLDHDQLLNLRDVSEVLGAPWCFGRALVASGTVQGSLVRGVPGPGHGVRRLISVGELVREGLLGEDGLSLFVAATAVSGATVRQERPVRRGRQRSIPADLPTDLADPRIGIDDPNVAAFVLAGLSRLLACDRSRRGSGTYGALRLLRLYAHTEVTRAGVVFPAPCPDVDVKVAIPTGGTTADNVGLPPRWRQDEWERLLDVDPVTASFDVNYVARHVPLALWRVFAALAMDGPALANDRLRRIVFAESRRTLEQPWGGRDTSAPLTERSIRGAVSKFRRFFLRVLVPMHYDGYPCSLLSAWTHAPPAVRITASQWQADRSAPSRPLLRMAWQQLDADVKHRLARAVRRRAGDGGLDDLDDIDAMEIVRRVPLGRLQEAALFRACRNRALLAMFAVLGGRTGATMDLRRIDFQHDFVSPDGALSAAIALRPGKHAAPDEVSWKPIPAAMARILELYLLVVERELGAPLPADGPLFIPSLARAGLHMDPSAFKEILGGAVPLLPKPRHIDTASITQGMRDPGEHRGPTGYSPQALRRAALQLVRKGARAYCAEHDLDADPECLAEVLLDHKNIRADTMGYADINTVQGRIRWSQIAIAINWEMLTTVRGARRVPDVQRYKDALDLQAALEVELKRAERELEQLFQARFTAVSDELIVELMVAVHRAREVERALSDVAMRLVKLEHDRDTWLILPDDAPDQHVDLGAVRRGGSGEARRLAPDRERWFLTVAEFAEFAGSLATARRWAGGKLPFGDGDPRNPWQPGDGAVDESLGPRKRRIDIDKVSPRYFDTATKRARRDELLAMRPRGFTRQDCAPPTADEVGERGRVAL